MLGCTVVFPAADLATLAALLHVDDGTGAARKVADGLFWRVGDPL
jgi:hypothetical protein